MHISSRIITVRMILLVKTWSFILRSRTRVCDSSWSVSSSLCLLRSNVSLCALNSDTTSSPTLSVCAAVLCERARLSDVRSNIARPSRTVRRVSSSQLNPDMIACKTQFRDKRCTGGKSDTQKVSDVQYSEGYVIIRTVIHKNSIVVWCWKDLRSVNYYLSATSHVLNESEGKYVYQLLLWCAVT